MRRGLAIAYAVAAYLGFGVVCVNCFAFHANIWLPRTVDRGPSTGLAVALVVDLGLIALFGLTHSVMARPWFKAWLTRFMPARLERSTYVMVANVTLVLLFWLWCPIEGTLWHVEWAPAVAVIWGLYGLGWVVSLAATFSIDHFALVGLKQTLERPIDDELRAPWLYRLCRHPLMFGLLLVFWATPTLTVGRLVIASGLTAYIFIGLHYEERALLRRFGDTYRRYQTEVPMLIPGLPPARRSLPVTEPSPSAARTGSGPRDP